MSWCPRQMPKSGFFVSMQRSMILISRTVALEIELAEALIVANRVVVHHGVNIDATGKANAVTTVHPADQIVRVVVVEHHEVCFVEFLQQIDAFRGEAAGASQSDELLGHPISYSDHDPGSRSITIPRLPIIQRWRKCPDGPPARLSPRDRPRVMGILQGIVLYGLASDELTPLVFRLVLMATRHSLRPGRWRDLETVR